jgi:hypothetical protein
MHYDHGMYITTDVTYMLYGMSDTVIRLSLCGVVYITLCRGQQLTKQYHILYTMGYIRLKKWHNFVSICGKAGGKLPYVLAIRNIYTDLF